MIGKTISHYKILEKLGQGGMGVVYRAEDLTLKRAVALKFLPPEMARDAEARTRFLHEARAAAALNHPNICTIYEICEADGQAFIAMALVEGVSLKSKIATGPLAVEEAVDIAAQVAEGLVAAHKKNIVHRDIKPDNIMITPEGRARIMDFGLAKFHVEANLTTADTTAGTIVYMSPEQTRGDDVDHRTDIWSLGVTLYEVVAGNRPFKGDYEQAVIYSILNERPASMSGLRPDIPEALERIVGKAIAKNPAERYQAASDLLDDLISLARQLDASVPKEKGAKSSPWPSIAVLPFTNMSADQEQEYFCDGMTEEIINALTQVEGLRVIARTSAFSFKGKSKDIREIGRELGVKTLLEGSVRKAGKRLRITSQLVNAEDGSQLWSQRYDRELDDVFAIQDEITLAVVENLKVKLLAPERARLLERHPDDEETLNLCLRARYFWNRRTDKDIRKAIEYYERAVEKDPGYALAHAGLADSYVTLPDYSAVSPNEAYPKAKEAALAALEIDDTVAEAHAPLALATSKHEWNWSGAEREFRRALELNPSYATAHHWYALHLMYMNRMDEAFAEIERALALDPLSLVIVRNFALVCVFAGRRYDEAIEALRKTIEMDPHFPTAHILLSEIYSRRSMKEEALAELEREMNLTDLTGKRDYRAGIVLVRVGMRDEAREFLRGRIEQGKGEYVDKAELAAILVALGEHDRAIEYLEGAYEERATGLLDLKSSRDFDGIRSDPRFTALLRKMGFEN